MACGGCGKRSQPVTKSVGSSRAMPGAPASAAPKPALPKIMSAGVRAQIQKRCSKCSWPMNSTRRFDAGSKKQIQIWSCMNRKCLHREEAV
jgi:ribosomal protein L37E